MSTRYTCYKVHEIQTDKNGDFLKEYTHDLPHAHELGKEAVKSWNDLPMHTFFDGMLKDKIASCVMSYSINKDHELVLKVTSKGIDRFRFTEEKTNELHEQVSAQFSDGWGESFFGPCFKTAFENGYYYAD